MTKSKHTPGPWRVSGVSMQTGNVSVSMDEHRIVIAEVTNASSFGDMIAGAVKRGGGGFEQSDCHTQFANARLIAAAPELLEAARRILDGGYVSERIEEERVDYISLSAAIANAEGRS